MDFNETFVDNLVASRGHKTSLRPPEDWQDVFLPSARGGPNQPLDETPPPEWRLLPFWLALLFAVGVLAGKLYTLQIAHGRENLLMSDVNRVLSQVVMPERGVILDRKGEVLARNRPGFNVVLSLDEPLIVNRKSLIASLARVLSIGEDEILERIKKAEEGGKTSVVVKSGVDRDIALKIEANADLFPGVSTEVEPVRDYVDGEVFAHILGFVGEASKEDLERLAGLGVRGGDKVGKSNLELLNEPVLKGKVGERLIEVDAFGHRFRELSEEPAIPGNSVTLTVDAELQKAVFEALSEGVDKSSAPGGAAVVQYVKTGGILALVSLPSFDPNLFSAGISQTDYQALLSDPRRPMFNRAVSGAFPPGSTFKMVTAAAALEEGVITPQTVIDDKGSISVGSFVFRGWELAGLGPVSLITAIAKSSDIYFYTVGGGYGGQSGVGVEKLAEWARRFGLGAETLVDLTSENSGLVPDEAWKLAARGEPWYIGNTYHMSIGQGDVLVTPLQLNNVTAAVANGGTLYKPSLLKNTAPEILRSEIASAETLDWVRRGMRAAASPGGTAYPVYDFKVSVAGKTGTSETGKKDKTHAWFTCFAPYESPEIAITVFLEEGGEGSDDAAPVVRKILEAYFE